MSQHALAGLIDVPQPQINGYINHRHNPHLDTVAKIAGKLGMPAAARHRFMPSPIGGVSPAKVRLSQILALAEHIGATGDTSCLAQWREAARAEGTDGTWSRFTQALSGETAQPLEVGRMSVRTRGFFLAATKLPARLVIAALTAHANEISVLLNVIPDRALHRQLVATGGETSYLVACCNVDLGDHAGALDRLKDTASAARDAADAALSAITLDGHSHFRAFGGDHRGALSLVEKGLRTSLASDSPGTMAHMWLRTAEEHDVLGDTGKAVRAWAKAEAAFARTDIQADRNWIRLWNAPSGFESVRAIIYSSAGRHDEAVSIARTLTDRLLGAEGKSDAVALVNAAKAFASAGLREEAAIAGRQALAAVRASEATGCMPRLQALARTRPYGRPAPTWRLFVDDVEDTRRQLDALPR
jgi:tetratricopeptide (TPR) repeat protein